MSGCAEHLYRYPLCSACRALAPAPIGSVLIGRDNQIIAGHATIEAAAAAGITKLQIVESTSRENEKRPTRGEPRPA